MSVLSFVWKTRGDQSSDAQDEFDHENLLWCREMDHLDSGIVRVVGFPLTRLPRV